MNKEYKDLDELGFYRWQNDHPFSEIDYSCYVAWWDDLDISSLDRTCLNALAFRFFREKYGLFGCIDLQACNPSHWFIRIDKIDINDYLYHSEDENIQYNTYEEAELACLTKLIKLILETKGGEVFSKNSDIIIEIAKQK